MSGYRTAFLVGALCLVVAGLSRSQVVPETTIARPARVTGERNGVPLHTKEVVSKVYTIDRIMKSMEGPVDIVTVDLWAEPGPPELLWLTGYRAVMTERDARTEMKPEFMCHSNLGIAYRAGYERRFPTRLKMTAGRLFSLDQGSLVVDLPEGFGIPIMSDQIVLFNSQVLNHNVVGEPFEVRQQVFVDFVRDRDLADPLIPLIQHGVYSYVSLSKDEEYFSFSRGEVDRSEHGPACSLGVKVDSPGYELHDTTGKKFSAFWVVDPGRKKNHTRVTPYLDLPYDTTLHYATAHLHPFAETLELRDVTTGKTVFVATAEQTGTGVGLARVGRFSSVEGVRIYKDHEYDLISTYNNTSGVAQDAMATMLLYLRAIDLHDFFLRPPQKEAGDAKL